VDAKRVERALLCSGAITWDLMAARKKAEGDTFRTAIVRLEQLYPRPVEEVKAELAKYPNLSELRWCRTSQPTWDRGHTWRSTCTGAGRPALPPGVAPESSSPAVGQNSRHVEENRSLMEQAFA
jgi:2-oxoglutarate dehydrogenase E1 component